MKISCPSCAAKYSIADDKVQSRLAKIRCRKCGTTIVIDGKVDPPSVYAAEGAAAEAPAVPPPAASGSGAAAAEYSVDFGDNDQRNLSLAALITAYNAGEVTAETYVWAEGMGDWTALGEVPEIVEALHASTGSASAAEAPAAEASAPAAFAAPEPAAPWGATPRAEPTPSPFAAAPAPAWGSGPQAEPSAPRAAVGRGAAADLFGGFDSAGSESDVMTSAPQPDLGAAAGAPAATGARNESSVLFSLSALTAAKDSAPSPSQFSAPSGTREDSGLIDLKALTAQADAAAAPVAPLAPAPLGFAPPLGGSPLGSPAMDGMLASPTAMPEKKSKMGLFIGGGVLLGCVVIAGAIIATSGKEPAPAPVATPAPTPTPAPVPTPEPEATVAAKPPATGTAEEGDDKPPEKKPVVKPGGGRPVAKQPGQPATTGAPAPAATPKKPAGNPCGCATGDLQCAMRCAAGG